MIEIRDVGANCVRPQIKLTNIGIISEKEINRISKIYENVIIDEYIIMPNHIHIIVEILDGRTQFALQYHKF